MPLPAAKISEHMQFSAMPAYPNGSMHAGLYTLIFRIRKKPDLKVLKEHSLVLMPQRFVQTTEARTSLYYTQGGPVADTVTPSGVGMTYFTIQGHTGFWGIRSDAARPVADRLRGQFTPEAFVQVAEALLNTVRSGGSLPLATSLIDGAAAIKDLQDTIHAYFFPAWAPETVDAPSTEDLQLEFLNLMAPTSTRDQTGEVGWIIHPHRNLVDIQQDARKPFLYQYNFNFAALGTTNQEIPDRFVSELSDPQQTGFQRTLRQITQTVRDITNGVNTLEDAVTQMTIQQVTGPVSTFLAESTNLGDALGNFISGTADKIRFPLYAQRTAAHVLDAPKHSVTTLAEASKELGLLLISAADPRSLGSLLAGQEIVPGQNDLLTLALNDEEPQTVVLPGLTGGTAIASSIQNQVRDLPPAQDANASAYRDFTATFTDGQYVLSSGTKGSDGASVHVVVPPDADLTPRDASASLGLGVGNGGQEQQGSAYPNNALALLRGMEQACRHLQAFPEYFADQLEAQDAALAALLPPGVTRVQIRGDQRMQQTRVTPGDTLQGIAARVGVPWETLALVNRLTYPYIIDEPTTLVRSRVSSADYWTLSDTLQAWATDVYQGDIVQIVSGTGAGQSRRILRNTATQLVLETAWQVVPNDISDYAIQQATNPIVRTGMVSGAGTRTLSNGTLALVPGSQRGLTVVITSGPTAGERRRIVGNDAQTYTLETPWTVIPSPGSLYALLGLDPVPARVKLVGDLIGVPQPSALTRLPIRSRLQDVSAITGQYLSVEEKLFGRDLYLHPDTQSLVYDPGIQDAVTIAALPNLRQAMIHYINLPLGELEYAPGLGSYIQEEIGLTATLPLQIQVLASVERTIRQDARIARMDNANMITQGGLCVISFGATAINGAAVDRVTIR